MRHLGKVAQLSKLKHVKDMCITDMLARTLKRIFNTAISQLIYLNCQRKTDNQQRNKEVDNQIYKLQSPEHAALKLDLRGAHPKTQESSAAYK